jgi:hypothetical protein
MWRSQGSVTIRPPCRSSVAPTSAPAFSIDNSTELELEWVEGKVWIRQRLGERIPIDLVDDIDPWQKVRDISEGLFHH